MNYQDYFYLYWVGLAHWDVNNLSNFESDILYSVGISNFFFVNDK